MSKHKADDTSHKDKEGGGLLGIASRALRGRQAQIDAAVSGMTRAEMEVKHAEENHVHRK